MATFLEKIFGDPNEKELKKLQPTVEEITALEPKFEALSDKEMKSEANRHRTELATVHDDTQRNHLLDDKLVEVFALTREAGKRTLGMRHFDVQMVGGIVLHQGKIAEMRTGEGKTLVATLPLTLNALAGQGAHLVTPNDYLAKVGAHWMGPLYEFLGISVGVIGQQGQSWKYASNDAVQRIDDALHTHDQAATDAQELDTDWPYLKPCTRKEAYQCDITYGTNNEFGFDYLRDNMALSLDRLAQRPLNFAIVDEVDSILIDEARTPLIISAPAEESAGLYSQFAQFVRQLKPGEDYEVDEKERHVKILEPGIQKMEQALKVENIYSEKTVQYVHHLEEALKAQALYRKDKEYVVKDGEVVIVDEFTGRMMPGRRYSEGLHQAIEAKEGVEVKQESKTLATITFQNLFRMYSKLAGMTGTAATEAEEFAKIYNLDVVEIPTHRSIARTDHSDIIYKTEAAKFNAVVEDVKRRVENGQPVLVGTASIQKSELLSKLFKRAGVSHDVLNAKQHEREAKIIEQAGEPGRVTVATNMAGRGVDILLGGKKPGPGVDAAEVKVWEESHQTVLESGGLAVIGSERHEARRIDNQLRGRSGRQGDPGDSQFYVSTEDDLMRIFGGDRLKSMMDRLGLPDNEPIQHRMIANSIEQAQRRVEGHNFDIRKHLVEYDDVMNQHREVVYEKRQRILSFDPVQEDWLHEEIRELLHEDEFTEFDAKVQEVGRTHFKGIERLVYLRTIDEFWVKHLSTMQHLREGIGLKGYAQRDPLVEYKDAAYGLFQNLKDDIENQVVEMLLKLQVKQRPQVEPVSQSQKTLQLQGSQGQNQGFSLATQPAHSRAVTPESDQAAVVANRMQPVQPPVPTTNGNVAITVRGPGASVPAATQSSTKKVIPYGKVGRNNPCPCGSGKKFKKCHGKSA